MRQLSYSEWERLRLMTAPFQWHIEAGWQVGDHCGAGWRIRVQSTDVAPVEFQIFRCGYNNWPTDEVARQAISGDFFEAVEYAYAMWKQIAEGEKGALASERGD